MSDNPFESPAAPASPGVVTAQPVGLGGFVIAVMIIDILFCALHLIWGFVGFAALESGLNPGNVWLEIATHFGMAVFGIPAAALILAKQRVGILLAWLTVLATVGNIAVNVLNALAVGPPPGADPAFQGGFFFGLALAAIVRSGLLIVYVKAVEVAKQRIEAIRA